MKRVLTSILASLIVGSALAGCSGGTAGESAASPAASSSSTAAGETATSGGEEPAPSGETVDFLYVVPGNPPKDLDGGLAVINEKLAADGVGVDLKMNFIPWDAWDQKINLMLSTGEKFDSFQVMNDRVSLSNYASRGALADITDILAEHGPNIMDPKINPEIMIKSVQVNGRIYAVPTYWIETALDPEITIRSDILKKYGVEVPKTFDELTAALETIMQNWEGVQTPYYPAQNDMHNFGLAQKTYDEWPFVVYDKIFYVDQQGNVQNFYETEVFKRNCYNAKEWYDKGLISPDILTTTPEQKVNQLDSGDWFVYGGTIGSITPLQGNYPELTTDDFINLDLAPEKPRVRPYGTRNMNAVPLASDHPEAAIKFFNWVYENQENYDLFLYGREGIDFEASGDRARTPLTDPTTNAPPYYFDDWMAGNINFIRLSLTSPKSTNDALYTLNESAVEGYAAQFTFNAENVQTQLADVLTQISAEIVPIACGVRDYDSNIGNALAKLKAAGVDELVQEFKTQLEASRAG